MMKYSASQGIGTLPQIEEVDMGDGEELNSDGSDWDQYLMPDNLHGMKLYREPYDRDIADMFVATGVGTMAVNSKEIILLTTNVNLGIETGHLVTTEGTTPFATRQTYVTGIGSTAKDLSSYTEIVNVATGTTTVHQVPMITVQDAAVVDTLAPNSQGVYTTFDFSKNPDTIEDKYAIEKTRSPYTPQTISIQGFEEKGAGVEIKYVNNGVPNSTQEWNKFLEGFPDPDQLPDDIVEVEEPKVGAGKIYYRIGFDEKPVFPISGDDAEEGDETQVIGNILWNQTLYETLPSCDNGALNDAISARDAAEAALAGDNDFPKKIELANTVRTKRNELNLSIWAYRCHIGDADDQFSNATNFNSTIAELSVSRHHERDRLDTVHYLNKSIHYGVVYRGIRRPMTYDRNDYLVDNDDDEYLTSILVDVNSRYYVLFSSNGDEKKVECDTVEDFMQVLELVRTVCDEDMVFYCDPVVSTKNAR